MDVVVRKSSPEVVKPPPETVTSTDQYISISPMDKVVMCLPATMFLVFDAPIHEPAQTIRTALSRALVHYLPMSGRITAELRITLTGEGVLFVAAAASCALKDADLLRVEKQLAIFYPAEYCGFDDPLLMMQVTEFSCGGFILGVTWNHAIADAGGMGQFLRAVGELARELPSPSVVPIRQWDKDMLPGATDEASTGGFVEHVSSLQPDVVMAILGITVPSRIIDGIKEDCCRVLSHPCTTFEAVAALLWQCRTRAIALPNPEDPVGMYFSVDARKYGRAIQGYYGNFVTGQLVMATRDAVANGHTVGVVKMIQAAKSQIADQFNGQSTGHADLIRNLGGYNQFIISSWRNLGLEDVDFGGGSPPRVTNFQPERILMPACVACQGVDGSSCVRSVFVKEEHASVFLEELSSKLK